MQDMLGALQTRSTAAFTQPYRSLQLCPPFDKGPPMKRKLCAIKQVLTDLVAVLLATFATSLAGEGWQGSLPYNRTIATG